jgi:hypothetical protein
MLTLAGLAISFALPTFAQEKDAAVDPQIVQQLHAIGKKSDKAFLKGDAAALAALYTEDAVYVTNTGPIRGRQAIEKYYADRFQEVRYFTISAALFRIKTATRTERIGSIGDHPVHRITAAAAIAMMNPRTSPSTCSQALRMFRFSRLPPLRTRKVTTLALGEQWNIIQSSGLCS